MKCYDGPKGSLQRSLKI